MVMVSQHQRVCDAVRVDTSGNVAMNVSRFADFERERELYLP